MENHSQESLRMAYTEKFQQLADAARARVEEVSATEAPPCFAIATPGTAGLCRQTRCAPWATAMPSSSPLVSKTYRALG